MTLDPTAGFILGRAIEARGRAWSTWTIDLDDEPTEPHTTAGTTGHEDTDMIDACIGISRLDLAGVPGRSKPCGFTAAASYGRRAACPRCGGDIEGRPRTREEADAAIVACLTHPCCECPDEGHHWLISHLDTDDEEAVEDFHHEHPQAIDEQGEPRILDSRGEHDPHFAMGFVACKHCPAVKAWEGEDH